MKIEILKKPANTVVKLNLEPNEKVTAEAGAMIAMSSEMTVTTTNHERERGKGGFLSGIKRMLAGESFFLNHFSSPAGGELFLATTLPGDMECIELDGTKKLLVQAGAFVAKEPSVSMDIRFDFAKNLFSGERMIWLELSGKGKVIIGVFGALYPVEIKDEYVVDTGNIAAYESTLDFSVKRVAKSISSSIFSGEGLVCRFKGQGTVYCQTHADKRFGSLLSPLLKPIKQ
ncbi:MAG: TIGR00266 family protein [Bacteroidales bacterium]